jgi:hypothetical protein
LINQANHVNSAASEIVESKGKGGRGRQMEKDNSSNEFQDEKGIRIDDIRDVEIFVLSA